MAKAHNTEPFVQAALIADRVLIEADNVVSAIRISDTFSITEPDNVPAGIKPGLVLYTYISLKSGDVVGDFDVELVLNRPNGEQQSFGAKTINLAGGIGGSSIKFDLTIVGFDYGKEYWLDVLWGPAKKRLTSIPFRFKRVEPQTAQATS